MVGSRYSTDNPARHPKSVGFLLDSALHPISRLWRDMTFSTRQPGSFALHGFFTLVCHVATISLIGFFCSVPQRL